MEEHQGIREVIHCRGHQLVTGRHPTTFEITTEPHLTPSGNCIIGVQADKGCAGLSEEFKSALANDDALLRTTLSCGGIVFETRSKGSSRFLLDHPTDLVWRRSDFVCGRTIGIFSDTVARSLPRELIRCLAEGSEMTVELCVTRPVQGLKS